MDFPFEVWTMHNNGIIDQIFDCHTWPLQKSPSPTPPTYYVAPSQLELICATSVSTRKRDYSAISGGVSLSRPTKRRKL